jgi:antitoxin (DNA-binding transcriptional repressor) of toxin-antitoxin stability system
MSTTVTLDEAQARLRDLVHALRTGDEIVIMDDSTPVAKLVGGSPQTSRPSRPAPGFMKGQILYMAPDFDAPLEDLREYME